MKKPAKVVNLNSLSRPQWDYVMGIIRSKRSFMPIEDVLNEILVDPAISADFREGIMIQLLECPASEMRG